MAIVVEHEKRKKEILQKALDVFEKEGFEDATFQKIADRCGITRTTLYIYFKNKHEIFLFSIKQLLSEMEDALYKILNDTSLNYVQILEQTVTKIIDYCQENKQLFVILIPYLTQLSITGANAANKIKHRVVRLRHIMSTILINGMQNNEFKPVNVKLINEVLYSLIEAAILQITIMNENTADIKAATLYTIENMLVIKNQD